MNKNLIAGGIALALCLTAIAPVYKSLSANGQLFDPANPEQAVTQTDQKYPISGFEELRVEILTAKRSSVGPGIAVNASSAVTNTDKAVTVKKPVSAAAPKNTAAKTAKKTTTAARSTKTRALPVRTAAKQVTSVSRGTTTTAAKTASIASASSRASEVIATARSYIGVPYVWGGESPSGFDCSGFTQYVLKRNGITIPRVTSAQYVTGVSVSKSNLRVGDLVFFTTYKPGPSHVGFYIGGGKFIHASSSKGVTISGLDSSYYSDRYIGARRVF